MNPRISFYKDKIIESLPVDNGSVSLRVFTESDITQEYLSWLNDKELMRYSNQRFFTHSFVTCKQYLESFMEQDSVFILLEELSTQKAIGTMTIHCNPYHGVADIGILIGSRDFSGKGVGFSSWQAALTLLEDSSDIRKVTAGTLSCNKAMLRIMEKSNMEFDGCRKNQEIVSGKTYDIVHYCRFVKHE